MIQYRGGQIVRNAVPATDLVLTPKIDTVHLAVAKDRCGAICHIGYSSDKRVADGEAMVAIDNVIDFGSCSQCCLRDVEGLIAVGTGAEPALVQP